LLIQKTILNIHTFKKIKAEINAKGYDVRIHVDGSVELAIKTTFKSIVLNNMSSSTLGCAVQLEIDHEFKQFLVTCAHGRQLHESAYMNTQEIGNVEQLHIGPKVDFSLIKIKDGKNPNLFPEDIEKKYQSKIGTAKLYDQVFYIGSVSGRVETFIANEFYHVTLNHICDDAMKTQVTTIQLVDHYLLAAYGKHGDSGASVWKIDGDKYVLIGIVRSVGEKGTTVAKIENCFAEASLKDDCLLFNNQ